MHLLKIVVFSAVLITLINNFTNFNSLNHTSLLTKEKQEIPWDHLNNAWRLQVIREIQRDHLTQKMGIDKDLATTIVKLVAREASKYGLSTNRILALIIIESWGDPKVISYAGAIGLMQVLPRTGRFIAQEIGQNWKGPSSLKNAETNIIFGVWYYQYLLNYFKENEHAALAAYNWGPENIRLRIRYNQKLPQVYPGKVYIAEKQLERKLWNEYKLRYWRGIDSFIHRTRQCHYSSRSTSGYSLTQCLEFDV